MLEQQMNLDLKVAYDYGREWIKQHGPVTMDWLILLASKVVALSSDFPELRKKSEENCTKIWNKWRKVVNLRPKRWRKVAKSSRNNLRKVAKPPLQISNNVESMLRRKVLPQIEEWYQGGCKKALLLTGARQVGKTTAVREFAKLHYTNFVEVNFVKRPIAQQAFDGDLDTKTIITNLSAMGCNTGGRTIWRQLYIFALLGSFASKLLRREAL